MTRHRCTRRALCLVGAMCLAAGTGRAAPQRPSARVVVIGGGAAGATAAHYLAMTDASLDVTLIEPKTRYTTCFFSNLYLAGLRSFDSITHGYEALAERWGIRVIHRMASAIDPAAKTVRLDDGSDVSYDRLVVAPGIAFRAGVIAGYDEAAQQTMPHAWMAGPQTVLLRNQLEAMEDGGIFVIAAPPDPFRCPPGPYERASMVASYFKRHKPRAKILILDAKDSFFEQDLFQAAWEKHYPGMIEWLPSQFIGAIEAVDVKRRAIVTATEAYDADVANVIPPQRAGDLAVQAGLADSGGWCPVDPLTFESTRHAGIHVIGDAANAGAMPKSAFAANSQAKACAFAVAAALTGAEAGRSLLYNTCYTYLAPDDAVSDAINFRIDGGKIAIADIAISAVDERAAVRAQAVRQGEAWYTAFTQDMFG